MLHVVVSNIDSISKHVVHKSAILLHYILALGPVCENITCNELIPKPKPIAPQ
jgi:hypothetical protein